MIPLEHVDTGDWLAVGRNFDTLFRLVPDTGSTGFRIRAGSVASNGTIISGTGFSVTKNAGLGDYTVTLSFNRTPIVVVGTGETAGAIVAKLANTTPPSTTGFRVFTFTATTGSLVDGAFHWIAVS